MDIAEATRFPVSREEVVSVDVRERILTVRLMEKVNANPSYAEVFGIVATNGPEKPERQTVSNSASSQL